MSMASKTPNRKLRRTTSGPPLFSTSKKNSGTSFNDYFSKIHAEERIPIPTSSSASPSIVNESPTSVLGRRLTRHASIDSKSNLHSLPPYMPDQTSQDDTKEVERLEATVGWLQSEVRALRLHLTLLEIQSANSLRQLKEDGRDQDLSSEDNQRVQVLTALRKELETELDFIKGYHNVEKSRNDEDVIDYTQMRRRNSTIPRPTCTNANMEPSPDLNPRYIPRSNSLGCISRFPSMFENPQEGHQPQNHYPKHPEHPPHFNNYEGHRENNPVFPQYEGPYDQRDFKVEAPPPPPPYTPYNDAPSLRSHYIERTPKHSRFSTPNAPSSSQNFYDRGLHNRLSDEEYLSARYESPPTSRHPSFDEGRSSHYESVQSEFYNDRSPMKSHYIERTPNNRRYSESSSSRHFDDHSFNHSQRFSAREASFPYYPDPASSNDNYEEKGSSVDYPDSVYSQKKSDYYGNPYYDPGEEGSNDQGSAYGQYDKPNHMSSYHEHLSSGYAHTNERSGGFPRVGPSGFHHRGDSSNSYQSEGDYKSTNYSQTDQETKSSFSNMEHDPKWQMASMSSRTGNRYAVVENEDSTSLDESSSERQVENFRGRPVELSMEMVRTISSIYRPRNDAPWSFLSPTSTASGLKSSNASGRRGRKKKSISITSLSELSKLGPLDIADMLNALGGTEDEPDFDPYGIKQGTESSIGAYSELLSVEMLPDQDSSANALRRYRALADQLMKVDPCTLNHEERLAFWINIYNSIVMHAFLTYGVPQKHYKRALLMHKATYVVGGHNFSIMAIEYAILRACSYHHTILGLLPETCFKPNDDRFACALDRPEPLVTFALCNGTYSSPALRIYSSSNVHHELQIAARDYLQAAIGITKSDKVLIPRLLLWYSKDFANDTIGLMEWVGKLLPRTQREAIMTLFPKWRCKALRVIQVVPYDWRFRYIMNDQ